MRSRLILVGAIALMATSLSYSQQSAAADAPAPAASAAAQDCPSTKPHDHGAERGTPSSKRCKPAQKQAAKGKAATGHDHGKMHKQQ
jgi:hypothetical protein